MNKKTKVYAGIGVIVLVLFCILGYVNLQHKKNQTKWSTNKSVMTVKLKKAGKNKHTGDLKKILAPNGFSGTAVYIKNNKIIDSYTSGYANEKTHEKNKLDNTYEINSLQKILTAGLVMKQVELGKIKLTDKLSKYDKEIPGSENITIQQMLNMHSGLSMKSLKYKDKEISQKQLRNMIKEHVTYNPEKLNHWSYQPVNYMILSEVMEKVTHQTYQQLFNKYYIKKLDLKETEFGYDKPKTKRVNGYYMQKDGKAKVFVPTKANYQVELGTGQVYMSATDFYRVVSNLLNGKLIGGKKYAKELYEPANLNLETKYFGGAYDLTNHVKTANGYGLGYEEHYIFSKDGKKAVIWLDNIYYPGGNSGIVGAKSKFIKMYFKSGLIK